MCKRSSRCNLWCVAGDFNVFFDVDERRGASNVYGSREIAGFDQFIAEMNLVDVPVLGKKFTWWSGDGRARSRLDRFLLFEELISKWQVAAQWIGEWDISDHCPIWLDCSIFD